MGKIAFFFPGQGSATVGMGASIAEASRGARAVLAKLAMTQPTIDRLRLEGPPDELIRTMHAQPAIFTVNCACLAALGDHGITPDLVAGHSLGEYSALVGAGVIEFEHGLGMVVERGAMMERCATARPGIMRAILGLDTATVAKIIERHRADGEIAIANDNAPGQVVISGDVTALDRATPELEAAGARVRPLAVGGAFHSELMAEAELAFRETLDSAPFAEPRAPLISNRTGSLATSAVLVREGLRGQITSTVQWRRSIEGAFAAGVDTFVEVGPGKVLSGIASRCLKGRTVTIANVEDQVSLAKTLAALGRA